MSVPPPLPPDLGPEERGLASLLARLRPTPPGAPPGEDELARAVGAGRLPSASHVQVLAMLAMGGLLALGVGWFDRSAAGVERGDAAAAPVIGPVIGPDVATPFEAEPVRPEAAGPSAPVDPGPSH